MMSDFMMNGLKVYNVLVSPIYLLGYSLMFIFNKPFSKNNLIGNIEIEGETYEMYKAKTPLEKQLGFIFRREVDYVYEKLGFKISKKCLLFELDSISKSGDPSVFNLFYTPNLKLKAFNSFDLKKGYDGYVSYLEELSVYYIHAKYVIEY